MASSSVAKLICLLLVVTLMAAPAADARVQCGAVVSKLSPCLGYLRSGGRVPPACCNGIRAVNNGARDTRARRETCECLKGSISRFRGLNNRLIAQLPRRCGVRLPFAFSGRVNCNRVR
ncbi:hypothetical protein UlMin_000802 [Ulmus minor]